MALTVQQKNTNIFNRPLFSKADEPFSLCKRTVCLRTLEQRSLKYVESLPLTLIGVGSACHTPVPSVELLLIDFDMKGESGLWTCVYVCVMERGSIRTYSISFPL